MERLAKPSGSRHSQSSISRRSIPSQRARPAASAARPGDYIMRCRPGGLCGRSKSLCIEHRLRRELYLVAVVGLGAIKRGGFGCRSCGDRGNAWPSFDFGGFVPHSYWDLYYGYGLLAVVFALFIAAALWLTSGLAEQPQQVRRFTGCIGVAVAIHLAIIARYFFKLPLEFDLAVIAGASISLLLNRGSATSVERES